MTDMTNYLAVWLVYSVASAVYYYLFWKVTSFKHKVVLSYYLRAVMLAFIVTPWYVGGQSGLMAPAVIVVLMDSITVGGSAAVRAFVPLFLSVGLAMVLVATGLLIRRSSRWLGEKPSR